MILRPLAALLATALLPFAALAQLAASVTVDAPWVRATPPGVPTGAAYLTLTSAQGDRLTGISTPVADRATVHETLMDGSIMRMRLVEGGLALPPGQPVTLKPMGLHIMLEGLHAPLRPGAVVGLHLSFAHAPPLDIQAPVQAAGAAGPSMAMAH